MKDNLIGVLILFHILVLAFGLIGLLQRTLYGTVRVCKPFLLFVMMADVAILIAAYLYTFVDGYAPLFPAFGLQLCALVTDAVILIMRNRCISFTEDHFSVRNAFYFRKMYRYDQIDSVYLDEKKAYIWVGRHKIMLHKDSMTGVEDFLLIVAEKGQQPMPSVWLSKGILWDPYCGRIDRIGKYFYARLTAITLLIGIVGLILIFNNPITERLTYTTARFVSYDYQTSEGSRFQSGYARLLLHTGNRETDLTYMINSPGSEIFAHKNLLSQKENLWRVGYATDARKENPRRIVYSLELEDGSVSLTEAINSTERGVDAVLVSVILGMIVVYQTVMLLYSVVIGRHPERFSSKTVLRFFQERHIH